MRDLDPDLTEVDASRAAPVETQTRQESTLPPRAAAGSEHLAPAHVASLQRMAGNAAVAQLLRNDESEQQETDHDEASPGAAVHNLLEHDAGRPLDEGTQERLEPAFGRSFDSVRVHEGGAAAESAEQVGAQAYTVGHDIVLGSGHPDLGSEEGTRVLAHELTHVVQQEQGPVDGTAVEGGIAVSDPGDRFEREAEHTADAVMSGNQAHAPQGGIHAGAGAGSVQRMSDDEGTEEEGSETGGGGATESEGTEDEGTE